MLQEVMTAPGVIEFREVEKPTAAKGQLLLKVMKRENTHLRSEALILSESRLILQRLRREFQHI